MLTVVSGLIFSVRAWPLFGWIEIWSFETFEIFPITCWSPSWAPAFPAPAEAPCCAWSEEPAAPCDPPWSALPDGLPEPIVSDEPPAPIEPPEPPPVSDDPEEPEEPELGESDEPDE